MDQASKRVKIADTYANDPDREMYKAFLLEWLSEAVRELVTEMRGEAARASNRTDLEHHYKSGYFVAMMDAANMLARALPPVRPAQHISTHEATHGWRNPPCIYEEQSE